MAEIRPMILRTLRVVALAVTAALPLVCLPWFEAPFSLPKVALLLYWTAFGGISVLLLRPGRSHPLNAPTRRLWPLALAWIVWVSLSAVFGEFASPNGIWIEILPVVCFLIFVSLAPDVRHTAVALVVPGAIVALIAILQWLGADPFALMGWAPALGDRASDRLRVYATLGNPNFVAAFLCSITPLWWSMVGTIGRAGLRRFIWMSLGPLLALGILATGSRIPLLAGTAVAMWYAPAFKRRLRVLVAVGGLLALVVIFSPARPLGETVQGRLHIWRVVLPHALEAPVFGSGPGSFEPKYAQWETAWLTTTPASDRLRRFAGLQDHAHNDFLEILVEHGVPGLVLFLLIPLVGLAGSMVSSGDEVVAYGAAGGLVALLGCALADFPLHRPTESFMFWMLLATIWLSSCLRSSSALGEAESDGGARASKEESA
jgi:putative inorganic carbon (HCO3(-)) transporter